VEALKQLVRSLPADFPAALLAVMHVPARLPSLLGAILDRCGPLPAMEARDGMRLQAGHIYVGVPDRHLLVDGEFMRLTRGPTENRFRPSIDTLFRSAAYTQGSRVVGVVLTGQLDDGTSGLWAIKDRGGVTVVQSPSDAPFPSMPLSALQHVAVDHVSDLSSMSGLLMRLAQDSVEPRPLQEAPLMHIENEIAAGGEQVPDGPAPIGKPSRFTCPECHGVLGEVHEGKIVRFRCHTGHAFSLQSLLGDVDESIDRALWIVLRTMQERAMLLRDVATRYRNNQDPAAAELLESRAMDCDDKGRYIRALLEDPNSLGHEDAIASPLIDVNAEAARR
jgi:two-component system chemotaxis response regulator CheB